MNTNKSEYQILKETASGLGLEYAHNVSKEVLQEMISKVLADSSAKDEVGKVQVDTSSDSETSPVITSAKAIKDNDLIRLKSTRGRLVYIAKKGYPMAEWRNKGDECSITYLELMEMKSQQPKFLNSPWVTIEDERVVERFSEYKALYEKFAIVNDLSWVITGNLDTIKIKFNDVPVSMYPQMLAKVTTLVMDGTLDSIPTIKFLEEKFKTQLMSLIP